MLLELCSIKKFRYCHIELCSNERTQAFSGLYYVPLHWRAEMYRWDQSLPLVGKTNRSSSLRLVQILTDRAYQFWFFRLLRSLSIFVVTAGTP